MEPGLYRKDGKEIFVHQVLPHLDTALYRIRYGKTWRRQIFKLTLAELSECEFISRSDKEITKMSNSETHYRYTLKMNILEEERECDCFIAKDTFFPYGEVREGMILRGDNGFMEIEKVFENEHITYGKFIAKTTERRL